MWPICIIMFLWGIVTGCCISSIATAEGKEKIDNIFIFIILFVIGIGLICFTRHEEKNTPTAMDVYRNKTELVEKGTWNESDSVRIFVPIDSTVVFKK